MPGQPSVTLVPFTRDLLTAVQPWFGDDEVRLQLGGPEWPERELRLLQAGGGEELRGMSVLRVHSWVALDVEARPVAKVGGDVYDRWTHDHASRSGRPATSEPGPAKGLAYVVDPERRRQGFGRAVLQAAVAHPDVRDVRLFAAGIDAQNLASRRCAEAAGLCPDVDEPDHENIVYHLLRRPPDPIDPAGPTRPAAATDTAGPTRD